MSVTVNYNYISIIMFVDSFSDRLRSDIKRLQFIFAYWSQQFVTKRT